MRRSKSSFHRSLRAGAGKADLPAALCLCLCLCLWMSGSADVFAQAPSPSPTPVPVATPPEEEARSTGLPKIKGFEFTFHLDAAFGAFGFANSFYNNPKPGQPSGDLGDNWYEGAVKPALSVTYTSPQSWQLFAKVSAVGERTFGPAPSLVGENAGSFGPEDAHIGWRSGKTLGDLGENALEFTVGRAQYTLGHGMLLWDGASEGGSRGGYWSNVRKAFDFAAIGRFKPGNHTLEVFYLDKDELPESETGSRLWGVNYQYAIGEDTTIGGTYMKWYSDVAVKPERNGLNVYNVRLFTAPFKGLKGLSFEAEYAKEDNGNLLDSYAWNALAGYEFDIGWKPKLSYRYAVFQGDDPATAANEAFDGLFTGFYDWGSWWQGEIAGEYFLSNSNLVSHQVRLHLTPSESIGTGLIFYDFLLQRATTTTSKDLAIELDAYMDWKLNKNFTLSVIAAWASPGDAVKQAFNRTKDFYYGMLYLAYSY